MPKGIKGFVKGQIFTEEHREKLSIAHIGKTLSEEHRRKLSLANKGRQTRLGQHWHISDEHKRKISEAQKGKRGNNWKGGTTPINKRMRKSVEFSLWRKAVFERDDYTCQQCFIRGGNLHPHHIKAFCDYPEFRFVVANGLTLCEECHKKTDNYARNSYKANNCGRFGKTFK